MQRKKLQLALLVLLCFFLISEKGNAQTSPSASTVAGGASNINLGIGNKDYQYSLFWAQSDTSSADFIALSTSTPYTILSLSWAGDDDNPDIMCGTDDHTHTLIGNNHTGFNFGSSVGFSGQFTLQVDAQLHCSGNLWIGNTDNALVWFQYVPYDTRTATNTPMQIDFTQIDLILASFLTLAVFGMMIYFWA